MKPITRILIALISISLVAGYFLPVWSIELEAPQYPEGLGMEIWINSIQGDLNTINGLNHYIGMKYIEPESIPELTYMPYILAGLIFLGLLTVVINRKWFLAIFVSIFLITGLAGGYDFYLWEYDYGHNLDPRAAIKVPGMNYQPPLWGSKQLLNFTAHSYPAAAGWIIVVSGIASLLLLLFELFFNRKKREEEKIPLMPAFASATLLIMFTSCSEPKPVPIQYGFDECALCRMQISDDRFGTEILTAKGKAFKFDSIECMVDYMNIDSRDNDKYYVTDYLSPATFIDANDATYMISPDLPSPMGGNLSAFKSKEDAESVPEINSKNLFTWNELTEELSSHNHHDHHH